MPQSAIAADVFLLGSNYIWGWEMNRVAHDLIADASGDVRGERYLPLGETEVARLIEEIRATRPDFVFNNLIGSSSYAFLRAYAEPGREDEHFLPYHCPVASCNLTECELEAIGEAGSGHRHRSSFALAVHIPVRCGAEIAARRFSRPRSRQTRPADG